MFMYVRRIPYDGGILQRVDYEGIVSKSAEEVVATAKYYLEHPEEWSCYNLITNNCEIFARLALVVQVRW